MPSVPHAILDIGNDLGGNVPRRLQQGLEQLRSMPRPLRFLWRWRLFLSGHPDLGLDPGVETLGLKLRGSEFQRATPYIPTHIIPTEIA